MLDRLPEELWAEVAWCGELGARDWASLALTDKRWSAVARKALYRLLQEALVDRTQKLAVYQLLKRFNEDRRDSATCPRVLRRAAALWMETNGRPLDEVDMLPLLGEQAIRRVTTREPAEAALAAMLATAYDTVWRRPPGA